jgi:intergrase/recombinase
MIALSKFKGEYLEFHDKIKQYGIKWVSQDSFTSFLKIFNNNHDSLVQWYKDVSNVMKPHEQLWLRYLALSGLRRTEAEISFNKILELGKQRRSDYINEKGIVEHFRFPKDFLRGTKNCYISIVPASLIEEIANSQHLCYSTLRKRLEHNAFNQRFKELRSFYSSFMARNGLMSEEIDLLQGRVPKSVFARHYLKENIGEFKCRVLEGNNKLETLLFSQFVAT